MDDGKDEAGHTDSYSVPAFDLARWHLGVVDSWADQVKVAACARREGV